MPARQALLDVNIFWVVLAGHVKEKGVTIRVGTYDDVDSLDRAMQGIDKVLLIAERMRVIGELHTGGEINF